MALRHRTLQEESKLKGADRSKDSAKFKLGQFRTLQNWIPAHVYSIKKKRGVELLVTDPITPVDPTECTACDDAGPLGQRTISIASHYNQQDSFPPNGNLRTSWGYIEPGTEEVWALIGEATCGGGNMSYNATCCQVNHWTDNLTVVHPALTPTVDGAPAINTRVGTSDRPVYAFYTGASEMRMFYPEESLGVSYTPPGGYGYAGWSAAQYAVKGDYVYITSNQSVFAPNNNIIVFDRTSGTALANWSTLDTHNQYCLALTDTYLYCAAYSVIGGIPSIKKLLRADGSVVGTFTLTGLGVFSIGVVNDDLIYLICRQANAYIVLYYLQNFNTLVFVGDAGSIGYNPVHYHNGFYQDGAYYWGNGGIAGFTPDIFKITLSPVCPSPVELATITSSNSTPAIGDDVTVTWANVLNPISQEVILVAAPAALDIGFTANLMASSPLGDTSDGSLVVILPETLTPGNSYVFMLTNRTDDNWVATSNVMTVTAVMNPGAPPPTNLVCWLDADQIVGLVDSDPVDTWDDVSGNNNDFTGSGAARPLYRDAGVTINGLPVVQFDGVNDLITATLNTSGYTSATIFMVGRLALDPPVDAAKTGLWTMNVSDFNTHLPYTDGSVYDGTFATARKNAFNPTPSLASAFQYNVRSASGAWSAAVNTVTVLTTASNTFVGANGLTIGKSQGAFFYNGVIAEVLIYNTALSSHIRNQIEEYLKVKYAL